jgi:hypothetical protein
MQQWVRYLMTHAIRYCVMYSRREEDVTLEVTPEGTGYVLMIKPPYITRTGCTIQASALSRYGLVT